MQKPPQLTQDHGLDNLLHKAPLVLKRSRSQSQFQFLKPLLTLIRLHKLLTLSHQLGKRSRPFGDSLNLRWIHNDAVCRYNMTKERDLL
ncbi:hypothetical protein Tco_0235507 [Tanacetum coccineum]